MEKREVNTEFDYKKKNKKTYILILMAIIIAAIIVYTIFNPLIINTLFNFIEYILAVLIIILFFLYILYRSRQQKKESEKKSAEYQGVIEVLAKEYSSVYLIDTESGITTVYRMSDEMKRYYKHVSKNNTLWKDGVADYAKRFVKEEYKEEFLRKSSIENLTAQLSEEETYFYYEYMNNRDGEQHMYRMVATLLPNSNKQYIVLGFADINAEREEEIVTQKALQEAYNNAQAANDAKSRFLFNMSHDLRTPMNAIIGFSDIIAKNPEDKENVVKSVEKIKKAGNILLNIINDVLDLARIESGKENIDLSANDFNSVVDNIQGMLEESMKQAGIDFIVEREIEHSYILFDELKVTRILVNILGNALKFTPQGGKVLFRLVETDADEGVVEYTITVKDTGIGMSEEFCKRAFEDFEREKNSTESGIKGTGLGLPIVRKLLDLMGGEIFLNSRLGEGTEVVIKIRFDIADNTEITNTDINTEPETCFSGRKALLVDDNELNREIGCMILKEMGFGVEEAENGADAIDMIVHNEPGYYDVVLMDVQMPVMDGYTATKEIRQLDDQLRAKIPIVAITANAFEEDRQAAINAGMNGHISKPIDVKKLKQVLKEVISL